MVDGRGDRSQRWGKKKKEKNGEVSMRVGGM
jgi:hypothetical protein